MPKGRILIIEDSKFQAKQTQEFLEQMEYEVLWADSGMSGIKLLKTKNPDLVLLDVVLPDVDGHEVCRWIKMDEQTRGTPVIMLTVKSTVEDKVAGLERGADDYLPKPFNLQELGARIYACLRTKSLQDELRMKNQQLEELLRQVQHMAITDALTGLYNRRHFYEVLEQEFSRAVRYQHPLALMLVDIDHFKKINDTYGHNVGDAVLRGLGDLLRKMFRSIETVARYGGEEFVILFPQISPANAMQPAARLLNAVAEQSFPALPPKSKVTISIGVTGLPDAAITSKDRLVHCSDFAMYKAKRGGRNRIETADGTEVNQAGF
jgi:diguanylate cyclase (GGDEF)-like protein